MYLFLRDVLRRNATGFSIQLSDHMLERSPFALSGSPCLRMLLIINTVLRVKGLPETWYPTVLCEL